MAGEGDSKFIWMNGKQVPFADANVHVLTHSLHYGSAAFEGIRAYKTKAGETAIFRMREHMVRFEESAAIFGGVVPYSVEELTKATCDLIKANGFDECYIRPLAYIGNESRGLKLPPAPTMQVAIATWRWGKYLGTDALTKGIKVCVASFRRPDIASSLPWAKLSGNYLNSIMARREASLHGCDEAILLDQHGYVAEGSGENIFVIKDGELITPPPQGVLLGITRASIMELARASGLTVREHVISRNQLYRADEIFFTGTAAEVTPVTTVDGYKIGKGVPGPISLKLATLFERCVRGEEAEYKKWLTIV